jgi:plasmid segregation protein ParM
MMEVKMLGIDVGFGDVKVVWIEEGNFKYLKVPTAVKYAPESSDFAQDASLYTFNSRDYIVGESAVYGAFSTRSFDFLKRYTGLFVNHVLKTLGFNENTIGVGLPLTWYSLKDEFLKELCQTVVDGQKLDINPTLFPQAVGILLDYRLDITGQTKNDTGKNGIIMDIGFNTVDVLCFENGTAVRSDSSTLDKFGISKIINELTDSIQRKYTVSLSEQEGKEVFRNGYITIYGHKQDISEQIRNITEKYFDELMHKIHSGWESRLQRADVLILAGGGAICLKDYLPSNYSKLIHMPEQPEFSNARGYLKGLIVAGGKQ